MLLLAPGNLNYGKVPEVTESVLSLSPVPDQREFKLGLQLGGAFLLGMQMGGFGEYKWNEKVGIRSGISYYFTTRGLYRAPTLEYVIVPILVTNYLGKTRQFCFLYGVEWGYLMKQSSIPTELNKLRKIQVGLRLGYDYEFSWGLMLGVSVTKYLIDVVEKGQPYDNWRLHGGGGWGIYPSLGINFLKLFNKLYHNISE